MGTWWRLAAFAAGLAVVFLLAFGVGRAVGPWTPEPAEPSPTHSPDHPQSHALTVPAPHPMLDDWKERADGH